MTQPIFAAAYSDDNGIYVRLFKTEAGAIRYREEIAKECWDAHFLGPMPANQTDEEIADHFFSYAPVYFEITVVTEIEE